MPAILFVEDDTTIAMGLEYSFKQEGFQVSLAYRLEEARALLKSQPFDLVLLDLGLPDGSGYELCKEIRAAGFDTELPKAVMRAVPSPVRWFVRKAFSRF